MRTLLNLKKIIIVFLMISAGGLTGCNVNDSFDPDEELPLVVGEITEIEEGEHNYRYWIKVVAEEWPNYEGPDADFVWLGVTDNSRFFKQLEDHTLAKLNADDLGVGQKIKGWPAGNVIIDLYPRGRAEYIVVVEE